jgi:hypothetical protein
VFTVPDQFLLMKIGIHQEESIIDIINRKQFCEFPKAKQIWWGYDQTLMTPDKIHQFLSKYKIERPIILMALTDGAIEIMAASGIKPDSIRDVLSQMKPIDPIIPDLDWATVYYTTKRSKQMSIGIDIPKGILTSGSKNGKRPGYALILGKLTPCNELIYKAEWKEDVHTQKRMDEYLRGHITAGCFNRSDNQQIGDTIEIVCYAELLSPYAVNL